MSLIFGKLNQIVTYLRFVKTDAYGKAQYEEPVDIPCRKQDERALLTDENGKEVISEIKLFIDREISAKDAFYIDSHNIRILKVSRKVDLDGDFSHCEVWL